MQKPPNVPSVNTKVAPPEPVESKSGSTDTIEDDSFAMNSDDDAFFAAVDLDCNLVSELEADVGRPLGEEEGIGGAIDFEEGTRGFDLEGERDVAGPEEHFRRDLTDGSVRISLLYQMHFDFSPLLKRYRELLPVRIWNE